jgi:alpha-beta hydrolase superfamily lysophospholipase
LLTYKIDGRVAFAGQSALFAGREDHMFLQTQRLETNGASLAYHHQPAAAPAHGILLVSHGLAEHSKRYRRFAEAMAARGYHVYAHVVGDVAAMREHAASRHPGLPVILFGHSMGGLVALNAAVTHPDRFDAVAVWNSNFAVGLQGRAAQAILLAERMLKGSDVPSGPLPKLTFGAWGRSIPGRRTPFDWLSRDPAEVDKYIADPLCGFDASVSLWLDIFELSFRAPRREHLDRLARDMPIHLAGGGKDPATDGGKAVLWLSNRLKKHGFSHITAEIHPDMRHETLNETGAEAVVAAFADWCDAAVPGARAKRTSA